MLLGCRFPVADYYKEHVVDGETIARGGGWWSAVLLIKDPVSGKPFIAWYRWQSTDSGWKKRKSFSVRKLSELEALTAATQRFAQALRGEDPPSSGP